MPTSTRFLTNAGLALGFLLMLAGCSGIKVAVDDDIRFDPVKHQRYAWKGEPVVDDTGRNGLLSMLDKSIRRELGSELDRLGYRAADASAQPDFVILYRFSREMLDNLDGARAASDDPTKAWVESGSFGGVERPAQRYESYGAYEKGKLELRLETPQGQQLWRGQVSRLIENMYPDQQALDNSIGKALKKLLADFPQAAAAR